MSSGQIDWASTPQLRDEVARLVKQFPDANTFLHNLIEKLDTLFKRNNCVSPSKSIIKPFVQAVTTLYSAEGFTEPPPFSTALIGTIEGARYRDRLLELHRKTSMATTTLDGLYWTLSNSLLGLMRELPTLAFDQSDGTTTVPLLDILNVPKAVSFMTAPFLNDGIKLLGIFSGLHAQLSKNILEASNCNPKKLIQPEGYDGTPKEIVHAYLKDTPLEAIFDARIPFEIPESARSEHTHILGPSGSGKTTLIQQLILCDLAKPNPPGMIIIDPKGLMVERLQSLDVFNPNTGRLKDRLIIVDPTHDPPPALNMFHAASRWNRMWSEDERRRIENQAIGTFAFIFSSTGSKLTDKQSVPFSYAVRLMFGMDSTIHTLIDLMDDPTRTDDPKGQPFSQCKFAPFIGRLDPLSQRFFQNDFFSSNYRETRQQIKARVYGVLQHPEFVRMFETRERKLDMLDCLQNRSIVLVNTSMNLMGSDASQLLGRYMIALTLNAAFARFTIPKSEWHPTHLIIDEFQEFADEEKTPEILRLAREYNLAVTLAHQEMHGSGMTDKIRSAISTNTTVKYSSRPEGVDISYVARDMRCEPEFLSQQTKTSTEARFACFVRGMTEHPAAITVPFGNIEREHQMPSAAYHQLLEANSKALGAVHASSPREVPKAAIDVSPERMASKPVSDNHPNPEAPTEAGKDW